MEIDPLRVSMTLEVADLVRRDPEAADVFLRRLHAECLMVAMNDNDAELAGAVSSLFERMLKQQG